MSKKYFIFLCLFISFVSAQAQTNWDTALIADSIKKDANAVIRHYTTEYQRFSAGEYTLTVTKVVTVLNENGISAATLLINYDNNSEIVSISESIYDGKGTLIKSVKKKEFNDYAYNNSFTMYSDDRVKYYSPSQNNYPYTVEMKYKVKSKVLAGFSNWLPQTGFEIATETAELVVISPENLGIKHKELNGDFDFDQNKEENQILYKWKISNLKPITYETSSPEYLDIFPTVLLSPDEIAYEGTEGNFTSWTNYGKWVYQLVKGRDQLSEETLNEIEQITASITDKREKVKVLYKYMQGKTRYVNIALGIGGFQPILASDVDEKGYGDCKALSNYMKALLSGVGIKSYYTEIGNGSSQKIKFPEFPSANQTNHVILCVPLEHDTTWLECTSQNIPFGYIGGGNSDRYSLLISEDGGKLAKTPTYKSSQNTRTSNMSVDLSEDGTAKFNQNTEYKSYLFEDVFYLINKSKDDQKKDLLKSLSGGGLQINDFSIQDISETEATAVLKVNGQINSYSIKTGNRFFIQPNFLYPHSFLSEIKDTRDHNLYESIGYEYNDSLSLNLPENLNVEFIPKDVVFTSTYGSYQISYQKIADNKILISRKIKINKGNFPKSDFKEINDFLTSITKQDKVKIVLITQKS